MSNKFSPPCPAFDKSIIPDYNSEGFDSVESTEFEPGFGCVPIEEPKQQPLPPEIPQQVLSEEEKKMRDYYYMSEDEKQRREDEYLAKHGIY